MKLSLMFPLGAMVFSLCAVAQDRPNDEMQVDRDPAIIKDPAQKFSPRTDDASASGGASAPKPEVSDARRFGEPPAVSPAGTSAERTAEPQNGLEHKNEPPTGEPSALSDK
jgi:hypothetical protein